MEASYYWLISVTTENISVALIKRDHPDALVALGLETAWELNNADSFLHSVDISLSEAAQKANLEPEQEPETSAFILPPKWIGNDGKIFPEHLKLLESLCHSLKLKPLGFISNDEAFIESVTKEDSFPPSFILLYLGQKEFSLSLVYLGEVKKRFSQNLDTDFTPQDLESALVTIRLDSALPPRILVFGHLNPTIIDDLKNYSWVGKKNLETFLHLPDVEAYQPEDLFNLYCKTVSSQLENNIISPPKAPIIETPTETIIENIPETIIEEAELTPELEEIPPENLGFSEITESDSIVLSPQDPSQEEKTEEIILPKIRPISLPKFKLPHFSLPHFHLNPLYLFALALSPLLVLLPYFLSKAEVTINLTPFEISRDFNITLDSSATNVSAVTIPVIKKTFDLNFTETLATTGQKETGDLSKGEITIFNKLDQIQNIPKSTILTAANGKKYELLTSVQVPASAYDLNSGTISMGQIKANLIASDIGPEYNQVKDIIFSFSNNANLLAKVNDAIGGGTRQQVKVVSTDDKSKLNTQVSTSLKNKIDEKIKNESSLSGLLSDTANIDKKILDYNREVGEVADTLSVNVSTTLSLFQIEDKNKEVIINTLLASDQNFLQSIASASDFTFSFTATKTDSQKSVGKLTITGKVLPKINTDSLRQLLAGKSFTNAYLIINSQPKVYNRQIKIIPSLFSFLNRLPPQGDRITIIEKF
ncbi:MAG: hypothetical protein WC784_03050 [Candidatus Shapirobacteria bacterium]|jgi:hypothetical protein